MPEDKNSTPSMAKSWLTTLSSVTGGERTIRTFMYLVFSLVAIRLILSNINSETVQLFTNILTGNGFANLVALVLGVISLGISIAFFVLSERRSAHASEKSTEMLASSQHVLEYIKEMIASQFESMHNTVKRNHNQVIDALQVKQDVTTREIHETIRKIEEKLSQKKDDSLNQLTIKLSQLLHENDKLVSTERNLKNKYKFNERNSNVLTYNFDFLTSDPENFKTRQDISTMIFLISNKLRNNGYTINDLPEKEDEIKNLIRTELDKFPPSAVQYMKTNFHSLDGKPVGDVVDYFLSMLPWSN